MTAQIGKFQHWVAQFQQFKPLEFSSTAPKKYQNQINSSTYILITYMKGQE